MINRLVLKKKVKCYLTDHELLLCCHLSKNIVLFLTSQSAFKETLLALLLSFYPRFTSNER